MLLENKHKTDSTSPNKTLKNQTPEEPTKNPRRKPKPNQSYQTPTTQSNQPRGTASLMCSEGHSEVFSGPVWDDTKWEY